MAKPDLARELVRSFAANQRMNQLLLERLERAAWRAQISSSFPGLRGEILRLRSAGSGQRADAEI
jgi:hypothetical protein